MTQTSTITSGSLIICVVWTTKGGQDPHSEVSTHTESRQAYLCCGDSRLVGLLIWKEDSVNLSNSSFDLVAMLAH